MYQEDFCVIEGFLRIFQWERKDFRGTPTLLFEEKNFIPLCGRRHVALMATDPITYASRRISTMCLGIKLPPLSSEPLDPNRTHLESPSVGLYPAGQVLYSGLTLGFPAVDTSPLPSYPDSFITYKVTGFVPPASIVITEEGLFPTVAWRDTVYEGKENEIMAYKRLTTPLPVNHSMVLDIWHQIRFGSNT
jgi:hypothetical protein